jgi:hypothetical protein
MKRLYRFVPFRPGTFRFVTHRQGISEHDDFYYTVLMAVS